MNISVPDSMYEFVAKEVKAKKYSTKSSFIQMLIREYEERVLLERIERDRETFKGGGGKILSSLSELDSDN